MCWEAVGTGPWSWALPEGSDTSTEFLILLSQQTPPDTTAALQGAVLLS